MTATHSPFTCTQSHVVAKKKEAKTRFLVPGSWLEDGLRCSNSQVDVAAAQRRESPAPLNCRPRPYGASGSLFSCICSCSLTRNRDHRELPKRRRRRKNKKQAAFPAVFPILSLPGCQNTTNPVPMRVRGSVPHYPICVLRFLIGLASHPHLLLPEDGRTAGTRHPPNKPHREGAPHGHASQVLCLLGD